ncbi:hypothetical protein J4410_07575 [Candidatus Woesearchaeota archaeon]|nr:hypothetical protein [Candidatus Woesearchaeota archaeon]
MIHRPNPEAVQRYKSMYNLYVATAQALGRGQFSTVQEGITQLSSDLDYFRSLAVQGNTTFPFQGRKIPLSQLVSQYTLRRDVLTWLAHELPQHDGAMKTALVDDNLTTRLTVALTPEGQDRRETVEVYAELAKMITGDTTVAHHILRPKPSDILDAKVDFSRRMHRFSLMYTILEHEGRYEFAYHPQDVLRDITRLEKLVDIAFPSEQDRYYPKAVLSGYSVLANTLKELDGMGILLSEAHRRNMDVAILRVQENLRSFVATYKSGLSEQGVKSVLHKVTPHGLAEIITQEVPERVYHLLFMLAVQNPKEVGSALAERVMAELTQVRKPTKEWQYLSEVIQLSRLPRPVPDLDPLLEEKAQEGRKLLFEIVEVARQYPEQHVSLENFAVITEIFNGDQRKGLSKNYSPEELYVIHGILTARETREVNKPTGTVDDIGLDAAFSASAEDTVDNLFGGD